MIPNPNTIGLIVESDNQERAQRDTALCLIALEDKYPGQAAKIAGVWPLGAKETQDTIKRLWKKQDLAFRAGCYRLGAKEGLPVRLYDQMGVGVITPGNLQNILANPAGLWLVLVELKEVAA